MVGWLFLCRLIRTLFKANCMTKSIVSRKSTVICIRLREEELAALDRLCQVGVHGGLNRSEWFRLCLLREINKSGRVRGPVSPSFSSELRVGRPKGN